MKKTIFTIVLLINVVYANAQVKPQIGVWRGTFAVASGNEIFHVPNSAKRGIVFCCGKWKRNPF